MTQNEKDQMLVEAYKKVLNRCDNTDESRNDIDELLRLKQESCNTPQELEIRTDDVVCRYEIIPGMEIVRCKTAIMLRSAGFAVVSKPTAANNMKGGALYQILEWYCDYLDAKSRLPEESSKDIETIGHIIVTILTVPLDAFTDMDYACKLATSIMSIRAAYYESLEKKAELGHEDTLEDAIENAMFEESAKQGNAIYDELKALKSKKDARETDK